MFQVAWLRVDTQTILTISTHVITKNHRISVGHVGHRTWTLHIKDTRLSDRGWYMCQVNTDPMSSNTGFLEVVGNCCIFFKSCKKKKIFVQKLYVKTYLERKNSRLSRSKWCVCVCVQALTRRESINFRCEMPMQKHIYECGSGFWINQVYIQTRECEKSLVVVV